MGNSQIKSPDEKKILELAKHTTTSLQTIQKTARNLVMSTMSAIIADVLEMGYHLGYDHLKENLLHSGLLVEEDFKTLGDIVKQVVVKEGGNPGGVKDVVQ